MPRLFGAALLFGEDGQGIVLKVVIYVLAVLTNFTVLQRIWWVWRNTRPEGVAVGEARRRPGSRFLRRGSD